MLFYFYEYEVSEICIWKRWGKLFGILARNIWENVCDQQLKCMYDVIVAELDYNL